jgi:radical SAM superfamily enzyme YgiQ (UPF0313 family)
MIPEARLLDASADDMSRHDVLRIAGGYELIVIHTSTPAFGNDARLAGSIKEAYPGTMIGFVGPHVTVAPEAGLKNAPAVDFVCIGEFDDTVAEIAGGRPLRDVRGVVFRSGASIVGTPLRPLIDNLDRLPFVTSVYGRDLTVGNYFIGYLKHPYISLYAGRGCRGRCTYCLWPQTMGRGAYRVRSADNVGGELMSARRLFPQAKEFFFDDDTFTDHPELEAIAKAAGRLGMTWSCNARANVPEKRLAVMKENGLRLLTVGFETGNQSILDNIRKGISVERARRFAKAAGRLGILIHGTFILGLPGETRESIEETIRFARDLDLYSMQVSLAAPYPGTLLYEQAKHEGWLTGEGDGLVRDGIQNSVMAYPWLSKEDIFAAVEVFYRRFYLRPTPILRILKEMLKDRNEFVRRIREGREFFSFMTARKEMGA